MQEIEIYRAGSLFVKVKPKDSSAQIKAIMGDNYLSLDFELSSYVDFGLNDYTDVFGETYVIATPPTVRKEGKFNWHYTLRMDSEASDLAKVQYLFLGPSNDLREPDFPLTGNAQTFMDLLLQNAGRILSGWSLGEVISTDFKNIVFKNDSCLSALSKIAEAFGTEWWVLGKKIYLTKKSQDTGLTFKHGRAKGLYEILRTVDPNNSIITRLYPYGSEKNLPSDYGSKKLRLTTLSPFSISNLEAEVFPQPDGTKLINLTWDDPDPAVTHLIMKWRKAGSSGAWSSTTVPPSGGTSIGGLASGPYDFVFISQPQGITTMQITILSTTTTPLLTGFDFPYLESNVAKYGVIEYTETFDDIYPRRTGEVSAVDATDVFKFNDADIDFDVNTQLLPGLSAKVVFKTGQLAGYTFEVSSFNDTTKEFKILKNKDEAALDAPSTLLKPAIGDKYTLIDISMPLSYIIAAENELLNKANELLSKIAYPQYNYSITLDPVYVRAKQLQFTIGDEIWVVDSDLGIDRKIRVVNTTRNVVNEDEYQLALSDTVSQGTITTINNNISSTQLDLGSLNSAYQNAAINNGKVIGTLKFEQIPETATETGFSHVLIKNGTGELYKKV